MISKLILTFFILAIAGCGTRSLQNPSEKSVAVASVDHFAGMNACFILYNVKTEKFEKVIGEERCKQRLPPCSTFKVPLAVMAFDSGVLKDENVVLKWDGIKRSRDAENKDHDAKTWMSDSVLWFSQRLTPKIGKAKFQRYLDRFHYGNRDLTAGITEAWVVSPDEKSIGLKISAYEQLEFMKKLWSDKLPASARSMRLARELTALDDSPHGFKFNGKTGSNFYDKERKVHFGWFISHLQKDDREYIAIANFSDLAPTDAPGYGGLRVKEITKRILADEGLW